MPAHRDQQAHRVSEPLPLSVSAPLHHRAFAPMRISMKKKWLLAAGAALTIPLAWYFGSPHWTVYQMTRAAEAGDTDRLSAYVDYPVLRENISRDFKTHLAQRAINEDMSGFAALGATLVMGMTEGIVDTLISPDTLQAVMRKEPGSEAPAPFGLQIGDMSLTRDSLNQFRLRQSDGGALIFSRQGLGWRLTGIRRSADGAAPGNATVNAAPSAPPATSSTDAQDLSAILRFADPANCRPGKELEAAYEKILTADGEVHTQPVTLAAGWTPLPLNTRYPQMPDDEPGTRRVETTLHLPAGTMWNGLQLSALAASYIGIPDIDSSYTRELHFKGDAATIRSTLNGLGFNIAPGSAPTHIEDDVCGGRIQLNDTGNGAVLQCSLGC
ncbi:DUF2939 domain-containing protein [Sphingomonas sp. C3-2]|uniref:DUF2939 domain-containing protein n=1 Tax=Sphingomonas sp. C3-2 TaxID=3062169 RepID=UPI00294B7310|nr:DUF2939 domain-containing protein [Sphingomonas sp. C3-2]WOK37293.1 DUF2939 domain-containing protein [Sphingomonas sp. C3-2]